MPLKGDDREPAQRVATDERVIHLTSGPVAYRLRPSVRARRVRLVVRPGGALEVVKPRGVSLARIEETLRQNEAWIQRTQARMVSLATPAAPTPLVDRQSLPFAGRTLTLALSISAASGSTARVALHGDTLAVSLPATAAEMEAAARDEPLRELLERWYRRQARAIIEERLAHWNTHYHLTWASVAIKSQKTRWGSCSRRGNLNFNWRLLLAPPAILDYVVIHELCHLNEHNHAPAFWALVERACPTYRESRRWLRLHGHELSL